MRRIIEFGGGEGAAKFVLRLLRRGEGTCRPTSVGELAYHLCMPVVFRYRGYRFFFYSNEGSPREPVHVHAMGAMGEAKFWLHPAVRVALSDGLDARTLRELTAVVEQNSELIEEMWHEYFG